MNGGTRVVGDGIGAELGEECIAEVRTVPSHWELNGEFDERFPDFYEGYPVRWYDDGGGPLWVVNDSRGAIGVIRAADWYTAYEIAEDEIFPSGGAEALEAIQAIDAMPEGEERDHEQACWDEAYGFRPNGAREVGGTGVYSRDLNCCCELVAIERSRGRFRLTAEAE